MSFSTPWCVEPKAVQVQVKYVRGFECRMGNGGGSKVLLPARHPSLLELYADRRGGS